MQVPIQISYRNVEKTPELDELIRNKTAKLERVCDYINSCRIAVERPHANVKQGNPFRIRIGITIPSHNEIVVDKHGGQGEMDEPIFSLIRRSFDAAEVQLKELVAKQRNETKVHPEQEVSAIVDRVNYGEGFGFIRTINGREIYFHKNSIVNSDFDKIEEGDAVRFFEEMGEKGPQASTVHVIGRSG